MYDTEKVREQVEDSTEHMFSMCTQTPTTRKHSHYSTDQNTEYGMTPVCAREP